MSVLLYIRKTTDWNSMSLDTLNPAVTNLTKLKAGINVWNNTFKTNYFNYRSQLKEISKSNWSQYNTTDLSSVNEDSWIAPTDDDDWFGPEISPQENAEFIYWRTLIYVPVSKSSHLNCTDENDQPASNGYAVRGSLFNRMSEEDKIKILQEHQKSLKIAKKYSNLITFVPQVWSIYNLHPGCAHVLKSVTNKNQLIELFKNEPPESPLRWSKTYTDMFCQLYHKTKFAYSRKPHQTIQLL